MIEFFMALIKALGIENFPMFAGWLVACVCLSMFVWRVKVYDALQEKNFKDLQNTVEKSTEEIKKLIHEIDDVTFNLVTDSTKTMAILSEKISSLQLIMMQVMGNKR